MSYFANVTVKDFLGEFGNNVMVSPMGSIFVVEPVKLVGVPFTVAGAIDGNFWVNTTATGTASATVAAGILTLATNPSGAGTGNDIFTNSIRNARYAGGVHNYYRANVRVPAATGVNTRRWGCFDANDGYYFSHDGTTLSINSRKATTDAAPVSSGSFNGELGTTLVLDTNVHTYEIHYTTKSTWFMYDGKILHKLSATTTTLTSTMHLHVGMQCVNGGANANNNTLEVWVVTINRAGQLQTQPKSARIDSLATTVLKLGPGVLHSIVFGSLPATAGTITIYDNTSAAGTILHAATVDTTATAIKLPVSVDFKGLSFSTGLTIVTATAASDFTVIYE
jgi:hypothetical protein